MHLQAKISDEHEFMLTQLVEHYSTERQKFNNRQAVEKAIEFLYDSIFNTTEIELIKEKEKEKIYHEMVNFFASSFITLNEHLEKIKINSNLAVIWSEGAYRKSFKNQTAFYAYMKMMMKLKDDGSKYQPHDYARVKEMIEDEWSLTNNIDSYMETRYRIADLRISKGEKIEG